MIEKIINALLTNRLIDLPRLTESAVSYAASLHLDNCSVLSCSDKGYNGSSRIKSLIHVFNQLLFNLSGNEIIFWFHGNKAVIFIISHIIERRNINPFDSGRFFQKLFSANPGFFAILIQIDKFSVSDFAFSYIEKVKIISYRLGIIDAGSSADNDGICLCSVF
ncbi:MAG: hypothetical protein BWY61_01879 [Firmicutes bacterium ADurb.Bin354]|nr:MAG: hypothetical protein BWY61_01879 [Firmicutes bacterium ADurb.Bin354]